MSPPSPLAPERWAAGLARRSDFFEAGEDAVRYLRDGQQAYPAMLEAIAAARREILLEMYWVGDDAVGAFFRDALAAQASAGVRVRVVFDSAGSFGLPVAFWQPLREAGGRVFEYAPLSPWRRRFRLMSLPFRNHRKILTVDGEVGFCGGLNLARPWLPTEEGGAEWRDDAIEVRGPAARELRTLTLKTLRRFESGLADSLLGDGAAARRDGSGARVWVLANRMKGGPDRRIRRSYLLALRRARTSIDIASAYFLPGPRFLRALGAARRRGVRVRILLPFACDVWLAGQAMNGLIGKLLREQIEVYTYEASVLHSKTVVVDGRFVAIGSHNLDTFSWRFNLETNVIVDHEEFAAAVLDSFERDFASATRLELSFMRRRPLHLRMLAWCALRLRAFL